MQSYYKKIVLARKITKKYCLQSQQASAKLQKVFKKLYFG